MREEVQDALNDGLTVYEGVVSFEDPDGVADDYIGMWNALKACRNEFRVIDGDLSY